MNRFNNLASAMNEIQDVSERYADHEPKNVNDIVFHKPVNDVQAEMAEKLKGGVAFLEGIFAIVMVLLAIYCVVIGKILFTLLFVAGAGFFAYDAISCKKSPAQVMTGTVVYKQERRGTGRKRSRIFVVTVKPDSGERVIYRGIQISEADYKMVSEGTPVLVVKISAGAKACIL